LEEGVDSKIVQIVITKVDATSGEMFKVIIFGRHGVLDQWHFGQESHAIECIKQNITDLVSA